MTVTTHATSAQSSAEGQPRTGVDIVGLRKRFRAPDGTIVAAVDDVTLHMPKGDFCVLLGPSGCGKTTLLRCLAGLERATRAASPSTVSRSSSRPHRRTPGPPGGHGVPELR